MNEAETRAELIDPALREAGWGVVEESNVRREMLIAPGRIQGIGSRGKPEIADYVLVYKNRKLAVIEAKKKDLPATEGVAQAKVYADKLQVRYTYSTNGIGIYQINMDTGEEKYVDRYPTPEELWDLSEDASVIYRLAPPENFSFEDAQKWRDIFASIPISDKSGTWQPRYYQEIAINRTLDNVADGKQRILLTLATGTGKTSIAFQIAWKLFHSRWTLARDGKRRPRILFLADRNILANQAFNDFSAFDENALIRIEPDEIRKAGRVPTNGSIFFTIFQTFMTGRDTQGKPAPYFGEYERDFFDFIVIDECHRGGASDESSWRSILEYFSPAVQLGLTATPKRKGNVDTYAYFGEPIYTYSLKQGINDGFLTPFKVRQIATTLDDYVYTSDDEILEGDVEEGRRYTEDDFNRIIEIKQREEYRVRLFMNEMNQREKTIVFCATQEHALAVRDLINQMKKSKDPHYCVRVTAQDGAIGDQYLKTFQDNEKSIPTILTTSRKLSTGVDARNVRNIVLMRPVKDMIEFKQIIGRGTRLFDDKYYFTIYDFVKAYEHFNDPEWDGEPIDQTTVKDPPTGVSEPKQPGFDSGGEGGEDGGGTIVDPVPRPTRLKIKLKDGKERIIQHMMATSFWSADGRPMSAQEFLEDLFDRLPDFFKSEDELRQIWGMPDTRRKLLEQLSEKGYGIDTLDEIRKLIDADKSDLYDVLAYVAFANIPITREERVRDHKGMIFENYDDKQQAFIDFVLSQYIKDGESELDQDKLPTLIQLKYRAVNDAVSILGSVPKIRELFVGFQKYLY